MTPVTRVLVSSFALVTLFIAGQAAAAPGAPGQSSATVLASTTQPHLNRVDINSASLTELRSLPGIGAVKARKIVSGRPYASVDDLKTRKILPVPTFEKIQDRIMVEEAQGPGGTGRADGPAHSKP